MIASPLASRMITSGIADSGISWKRSRIERAWLMSSCISACAAAVTTNAVSRITPIDRILALIWHPPLLWLQETSSENLYQALRKNQPVAQKLSDDCEVVIRNYSSDMGKCQKRCGFFQRSLPTRI